MNKKKTVLLFDIDGTLIITDGAGATSWSLAFKELYNLDVNIENYSDNGMTDQEVARRSFVAVIGHDPTESEFSTLIERRMNYLTKTVTESDGYEVLAGVTTLLPRLVERGFLLGLVTGNLEAAAHIKLQRADLNRFFTFGGYGSDSDNRGELTSLAMKRAIALSHKNITNDQFLAIGDTPNDVYAAHEAGIECVGVASHKYSKDELAQAKADYVIESLEEDLPIW